jgi:diguanylate cyclase (GGDEF)-like protein/PAS domain S-box-containing protein
MDVAMGRVDDEESFFRQVVDELPDLVCRFAPDGTLLYVNRAYARYFASTRNALTGTNFLDLVPPDERAQAEAALRAAAFLTPDEPTRTTVHRGGDRDGVVRWQEWVDQARFDHAGALVDLVAVGRDVTERQLAHEMLRHLSERDPLTELLNRRSTLDALDRAIDDAPACTPCRLGVVYVDVDGFKGVNDRYGHGHGDRLLVTVSQMLTATFRHSDIIGRIGGDEFVVICPDLKHAMEVDVIADRFAQTLSTRHAPVSASYGTAVLVAGESATSLLHRADMAMYRRKRSRVLAAG